MTRREFGVVGGLAIVLNAPALVRSHALNGDEATIAVVARVMRHGGSLYRDTVDRKPPGAFVLYRLLEPVFGTWTLAAARWVAMGMIVAAAWILADEAVRRRAEVSRLAVAVLFILTFAVLPAEDSRAVGFELLATLPAVGAFVLAARGRTLAAGICLGLAALFKQPMLLGCLPLTYHCLRAAGDSWPQRLRRLAVAGTASVLTLAAGLAPFGLPEAWTWFAGVGDNYLGGTTIAAVLKVSAVQIGSALLLCSGVVVLVAIAWRRQRPPIDVVVWLASALIASAIGFRFVLHYFIQALPALVLLASPVLAATLDWRQRKLRIAQGCMAAAIAYGLLTSLIPATFHTLPEVDEVSAAVAQRTVAGDKVFVWGQAPEIYWLSGRDPATRYPHVGFVTGITPKRPDVPAYVLSTADAAQTMLADLRADPPTVIIDAAFDDVRGGDRYPMTSSPVAEFVADGYCQVQVIGQIRLFEQCDH